MFLFWYVKPLFSLNFNPNSKCQFTRIPYKYHHCYEADKHKDFTAQCEPVPEPTMSFHISQKKKKKLPASIFTNVPH